MSRAKAVFVPTQYFEPFGGVAVEAQMCGTPVISSDFGVFNETVLHGITGYRCRTLDQYVWAINNVHKLDPIQLEIGLSIIFLQKEYLRCMKNISKCYMKFGKTVGMLKDLV
jgi:glycosyltransferase involved in cell wall biosynthesis